MRQIKLAVASSWFALIVTANVLVACGGESQKVSSESDWSTGSPGKATLSLTLSGSQLHFSWPNQSGVTEYQLLENPDGISGYSVIATLSPTTQNQDINIFLPDRVNASYIIRVCNTSGCTDSSPVFVSGNLAEAISYIKASNTDQADLFGSSLALSNDGNTLVVGALGEASNSAGINGNQLDNSGRGGDYGTGAVYVFTYDGTTWKQQAYLKASNPDEVDWFGKTVSISGDGDTLAVGAPYEDSIATGINGNQSDNSANGTLAVDGSGAVYIFTRLSNNWTQQAYIKASNTDPSDYFGSTLALSDDGNTLAVGAPYEDSITTGINGNQLDNTSQDSGAAYLFTRSGSTWSQEAYIKSSNTFSRAFFSGSLAISADGNIVAISGGGKAFIFSRSGSTWTQSDYIDAPNIYTGAAIANLTLSKDGNTLAVATQAPGCEIWTTNCGSVAVFYLTNNTWSQEALLMSLDTSHQDGFGESLSLSSDGNMLVVGASSDNSDSTGIGEAPINDLAIYSGAVYVFVRSNDEWIQKSYLKASNTDSNDHFGRAAALSGNGKRLAVGALYESSIATGVGGNQADDSAPYSGAVYLY